MVFCTCCDAPLVLSNDEWWSKDGKSYCPGWNMPHIPNISWSNSDGTIVIERNN